MNSVPFLFKKRLVDNRLEHFTSLNIPDFDRKYEEICKWCIAANDTNLDKIKETAVQGTFMTRVFNQILGYTEIIDNGECYNQERENKTKLDSTEADAALGYFNISNGKKDVRAVVELKSAGTPLDKKQNRNNHLTPVEQAFLYAKKNGKNCGWVIVSNYIETRLYKSNSMLEYETFDIRKMDDKKEFLMFYYFLCKDNLISQTDKSVIDEFYQENEIEGIKITNDFYELYKKIRNNLFSSLKENNPQIDEITLFTKAQKIMDRLIFICFCEDCGLLPSNTIQNLIDDALKPSFAFIPNKLWQSLCGLFYSIDVGNPPMKINRYNGGLFKNDEILNNLIVLDEVVESFKQLSKRDFNSELNVNILGQIFEQSISDIEQIKNEIQGIKSDNNKQKDDGVFYTPYYVTQYIVENTVGTYLKNKKEELKIKLFEKGDISISVKKLSTKRDNTFNFSKWEELPENVEGMTEYEKLKVEAIEKLHLIYWTEYENVLRNLKICDPSCGSGAFLNQCFDFLHREIDFVREMEHYLRGQLPLFDIDKSILQNNLYGVDINPESVEITKLSLWLKTAKKDRLLTSLDGNIKCGNSIISDKNIVADAFDWQKEFPEVFAQGGFDIIVGNPPYGAKLEKKEKDYILKTYETTEGKFNTYHTFIELSMRSLLKDNGYLGFITPNTYLTLEQNTVKLRKFLFDNYSAINFVELYNVFPNAIVEPIISIFYKGHVDNDFSVISIPRKTALSSTFINEGITTVFKQSDLKMKEKYIFNYRETDKDKRLKNKIKKDSIDIQEKFNVTQGAIPYGKGGTAKQTKEIIKNKPYTKLTKEDESWLPYYKGRNINRYVEHWTGEYIKWGKWLCRPRSIDVWNVPKLFIRQTSDYPVATYIEEFKIGKNSIHSITKLTTNNDVELKYLLGLINSKLIKWVFQSDNFQIVGQPLAETKAIYIKRLPLKVGYQAEVIAIVDKLLELNHKKITSANKFLKYLQSMYNLKKLTDNLIEFYLYDFKTLLSELKKQKVKIPAKDKIELMELFDEYKHLIEEDNIKIQNYENKIDTYIYNVFELEPSEINYIEDNI